MNAYRRASSLRRVFAAATLLTTGLMTLLPGTARAADDMRTTGPVDRATPSPDVRELPTLPEDLRVALASPEVTSALGGQADVVRAKAVEIGPEHVLAAWAPSITDPRAAVAVARNGLGELRVVTVREEFPGTVQVGTGGGSATLRVQPGSSGQPLEFGDKTAPAAATSAYWDCFSACFTSRAVACTAPCVVCKSSGLTQCADCYACVGYWGIFCAVSC